MDPPTCLMDGVNRVSSWDLGGKKESFFLFFIFSVKLIHDNAIATDIHIIFIHMVGSELYIKVNVQLLNQSTTLAAIQYVEGEELAFLNLLKGLRF